MSVSDAMQTIDLKTFDVLIEELKPVAQAVNRQVGTYAYT